MNKELIIGAEIDGGRVKRRFGEDELSVLEDAGERNKQPEVEGEAGGVVESFGD